MKHIYKSALKAISAIAAACLAVQSCGYDDGEVSDEIGKVETELSGAEAAVDALESQIGALNTLINSSFISYIGTDEAGNYVISYMNGGGDVKTLVLALGSDIVTVPVVGAAEAEDGKMYWRQTADNGKTYTWVLDKDGNRMPVGGSVPEVSIDKDGYWTVNGVRVTGPDGAPVLADDASNRLFRSVEKDGTTGEVVFTLADGTSFSIPFFEALGIDFDSPAVIAVPDRAVPARINYTLKGSMADSASVDYFTAYNVSVSIDTYAKQIAVTLDEGAEEGNTVIMVSSGKSVVLKPIFFTYGTAEIQKPVWDNKFGTGTEIALPGDFTEFDIRVSHNIDYTMSISDDCASWLKEAPVKSAMVTTTHSFIADYYESTLGADRKGTITFTNKPYGVTVEVAVRQSPVVPDTPKDPGISTGADLVAFAKAVNSGASTSRWENAAGEVVLLNDIDITGLNEWTPIGSATASGTPSYKELVTPFTGVFNGQGHTIKGISWTFNPETSGSDVHGFFGALKDATVKNLILGAEGDRISIEGASPDVVAVGALAGYIENTSILNVRNNVSVVLTGDNPDATLMMIAGIAGCAKNSNVGGDTEDDAVINAGDVKTGKITNTANGGTGMQVAGIVAWVKEGGTKINYCINYGEISAPTGRGGGIVGTMGGTVTEESYSVISNCTNAGLIQDDIVGQFGGAKDKYGLKRMGGILGGTDGAFNRIEYCTNTGNVFSQIGCRTGGFAGHNKGQIVGCVNKGIILANITYDSGAPQHGPGWACGYSGKGLVTQCAKGGKVGEWDTYKDNPSAAPDATDDNALCYKNSDYYDPSKNF